MQIVINGESQEVPSGVSVAQLLEELKMTPRSIAVERNRELVPRAVHADCILEAGDSLEIVTLTGGG